MSELPYRVVHDDDAVHFFRNRLAEPATPEHVDEMVDEAVDGGADLFLECCCYHRTTYPSSVWETMWAEYEEHGTSYGEESDGWIAVARQLKRLADVDCDFLDRVLARCRERGIASGVTVRMDDRHFRGPEQLGEHTVDERLSRLYRNDDLYLADTGRHGGRFAFDYERPEVRDHYLSLIREVIERYDFEVLSLDYVRHPPFFDREDVDDHCETMTGFLREVDGIRERSEHDVAVLARVPSTPANCRGLGLDVAAWARESLVDGIAPGMKNCTGWETPVDAFRRLVGADVSIYPCTERQAGRTSRVNGGRSTNSATPWSRKLLRGFTAGQRASGADGVYLFNFFIGNRPLFDVLAELKSLDGLRGKPKSYRLTTYGATINVESDLPAQVPVDVPPQRARRFEVLLAEEPGDVETTAHVILDRRVEPDDVWLQLNDLPLEHAGRVREEPIDGEGVYSWWDHLGEAATATFDVPTTALGEGRNSLVVRNERGDAGYVDRAENDGKSVTVLGIALHVG